MAFLAKISGNIHSYWQEPLVMILYHGSNVSLGYLTCTEVNRLG